MWTQAHARVAADPRRRPVLHEVVERLPLTRHAAAPVAAHRLHHQQHVALPRTQRRDRLRLLLQVAVGIAAQPMLGKVLAGQVDRQLVSEPELVGPLLHTVEVEALRVVHPVVDDGCAAQVEALRQHPRIVFQRAGPAGTGQHQLHASQGGLQAAAQRRAAQACAPQRQRRALHHSPHVQAGLLQPGQDDVAGTRIVADHGHGVRQCRVAQHQSFQPISKSGRSTASRWAGRPPAPGLPARLRDRNRRAAPVTACLDCRPACRRSVCACPAARPASRPAT